MIKLYVLKSTCPYYGDVDEIGIYSSTDKMEQAKEIVARCSRIDDYAERLSVDEVEIDKMPYDSDTRGLG